MIKKVKTKDLHSQNIIIENQDDKVDIKFPIKYTFDNNYAEAFMFQTPKLIFEKIIDEGRNMFIVASLKNTQASKVFLEKILSIESKMIDKINSLSNSYGEVRINESCLKNKPYIKFKIKKHYGKPQLTIGNKTQTLITIYDLKQDDEIICNVSMSALWFYSKWGYYLNVEEILVL